LGTPNSCSNQIFFIHFNKLAKVQISENGMGACRLIELGIYEI